MSVTSLMVQNKGSAVRPILMVTGMLASGGGTKEKDKEPSFLMTMGNMWAPSRRIPSQVWVCSFGPTETDTLVIL